MTDIKTFFEEWMQAYRTDVDADISPKLASERLAIRFEDDARDAGYGRDEQEDEIGIVDLIIREKLEGPGFYKDRIEAIEDTPSMEPVLEALEPPEEEVLPDKPRYLP
jgi:hypothetical protein